MPSRTTRARSTTRKDPVRPDDLKAIRMVAQPRVSPDGNHLVFVRKQVGDKNSYKSNLWLAPTDGSTPPRQFTRSGKDAAPAWSSDGERIAFVSGAVKNRPQIHVISTLGGESEPVTEFPEGTIAGFAWSPDGTRLAVRFRPTADEWTADAVKKRSDNGTSDPPWVIEDPWYRLDGDGYFGEQRFHLYLVSLDDGTTKKIYDKDRLGGFDFDWSPDSKRIAITANRSKRALVEEWKCQIDLVDARSGKISTVRNLPEGHKSAIQWSPDGTTLAYAGRIGSRDGAYSVENLHLYTVPVKGGTPKCITGKTDYCLLAATLSDTAEVAFAPTYRWSPDSKALFVKVGWHGESHIARYAKRGGAPTFLTKGAYDFDLGNIDDKGTTVALTRSSATKLSEVFVGRLKNSALDVKRITNFNAEYHKKTAASPITSMWVTTADGTKCQVWAMFPPGHAKTSRKKYPAILEIHGGPHAQYGVGFFHEFQVLASAGYAVFFSNPRGSKGYGESHTAAIKGAWGTADWVDMQAVIEAMKSHANVDTKRMGIMGGSYGGYMTNWAIGNCRDFAGAITDRCVSNLVSMGGNSDYIEAEDSYFPGNFWSKPEARWESSPIRFFDKVKTPTLIIHSEGDLRCNIEQGEQVFSALKLRNIPCRFVRYPRSTSHGMSRAGAPDMRLHRLDQILQWWKQWLS